MSQIPRCEVSFHPHSFGDPAGRLFRWNGQLYRGIRSGSEPFVRRLFQDGIVQKLVNRGILIDTELTPLAIDGYEMVVRHRDLPFPSYPEEWCPAMLKDAALTIIDLLVELARYDLTLKDGHPWNVLFDGCRPIYVDFTSIIPRKDTSPWTGYDAFSRFCLNPLILMAHGQDRIARRLLLEYDGVLKSDVSMLTGGSASLLSSVIKRALKRVRSLFPVQLHERQSGHAFLEGMKAEIESLQFPIHKTEISYNDDTWGQCFSPQDMWTVRQRAVHKVLSDHRPKSVLNIGGKTGWYAKLAAFLESEVVTFDLQCSYTTELYYEARKMRLPVLPLVMDFTDPTPSRGLCSHWSICASERFQCDIVVALDLIPHLVCHRYLNFDQIVHGLSLFSKRALIVEFVPWDVTDVCGANSDYRSWYTVDTFVKTLRKEFRIVRKVGIDLEQGVLLLCER